MGVHCLPLQCTHEIFIFSPYITGDVLDEIIQNADNKTINIVTSLKAQSVISKSLDIDLLKRLIIEGAKLFSHPNLRKNFD